MSEAGPKMLIVKEIVSQYWNGMTDWGHEIS